MRVESDHSYLPDDCFAISKMCWNCSLRVSGKLVVARKDDETKAQLMLIKKISDYSIGV